MIVILGDIHFSSSKDYFNAISNEIINWIEGWEHNNEDNELILVGDLVQNSINAGLVVEYLYRFFKALRFKHIHIVEGNHDKKLKDGVWQLAYSFLGYEDHVTIYSQPTITTIQNKTVLLLPYYIAQKGQLHFNHFYSKLYEMPEYQRHFDLVVGHFADDSFFYSPTESVQNLDKLDADIICLGHVHTRNFNVNRYIGSIYANRVNENAHDRAAWLIDENGKREELLPLFNEFLVATYPNPLPKSKSLVPIYTITNCATEAIAKAHYGNVYIRRVIKDLSKSEVSTDFNDIFLSESSVASIFDDFMRNHDPPLDRRVAAVCVPLIKNPTN